MGGLGGRTEKRWRDKADALLPVQTSPGSAVSSRGAGRLALSAKAERQYVGAQAAKKNF